jgi:hypothetical protein
MLEAEIEERYKNEEQDFKEGHVQSSGWVGIDRNR